MRKRRYVRVDGERRALLKKRLMMALALPVLLYLLAVFIFGEMGLVKYYRMKAQHAALLEEIEDLKFSNQRLLFEVHALKNDPAYIEKLARDNLGLAHKGELIYYYGDAAQQ